MRRLIVNADDFGLTGGINRAILDLYRDGGLTSATLMAASPQSAEAVALAKQETSLGVGCHVVLLDGSPSADPALIASLLSANDTPRFRFTLGEFVRDLYLGRIEISHIEREATAQILHLQQAGVRVTHVDTHKHTHMFPVVLDAVTRAATVCGVRAIRNPFEPAWSMAATPNAGSIRKLQVHLLRRFRRIFLRLIQERNLATTDGCIGVLATGTLDERALHSILSRMPEGTWELVCHPAYLDDELRSTRTRLQASRQVELSALQSLSTVLAGLNKNIELMHFGQLPSSNRGA